MVHVLELLGCIANGPTTEQALGKTPKAISDFLRFLHQYGGEVDPDEDFQTEIADHVTEGVWLGKGDPSIVFQPDLQQLTNLDTEKYIQRLEWMHADMLEFIIQLSDEQMNAKPQSSGRPIQEILEHILESEYAYMYAFGRIEGLPASGSIVTKRETNLLDWIGYVRSKEYERLRSLNQEERSQPFIHWKYTRTARKVMRRMLEHQWEHLVEIKERMI